MSDFFIGLIASSIFGLIIGLVKPSLLNCKKRSKVILISLAVFIGSFVAFGVSSSPGPSNPVVGLIGMLTIPALIIANYVNKKKNPSPSTSNEDFMQEIKEQENIGSPTPKKKKSKGLIAVVIVLIAIFIIIPFGDDDKDTAVNNNQEPEDTEIEEPVVKEPVVEPEIEKPKPRLVDHDYNLGFVPDIDPVCNDTSVTLNIGSNVPDGAILQIIMMDDSLAEMYDDTFEVHDKTATCTIELTDNTPKEYSAMIMLQFNAEEVVQPEIVRDVYGDYGEFMLGVNAQEANFTDGIVGKNGIYNFSVYYPSRQAILDEQNKPDLELVSYENKTEQYGSRYVVGIVKNNTESTYGYVQIDISMFDKDGNLLGSTLDNVNDLGPGGTWKFKALIYDDDCTNYKITDVSGF